MDLLHRPYLLILEAKVPKCYTISIRSHLQRRGSKAFKTRDSMKTEELENMDRKILVNQSIDFIIQHLDEDLSLDDMAAQFYLSKYGRSFCSRASCSLQNGGRISCANRSSKAG